MEEVVEGKDYRWAQRLRWPNWALQLGAEAAAIWSEALSLATG
jgi:hypothetical protein